MKAFSCKPHRIPSCASRTGSAGITAASFASPTERDSWLNDRVYFVPFCRGFPGVFFGASSGSERWGIYWKAAAVNVASNRPVIFRKFVMVSGVSQARKSRPFGLSRIRPQTGYLATAHLALVLEVLTEARLPLCGFEILTLNFVNWQTMNWLWIWLNLMGFRTPVDEAFFVVAQWP